MASGPDKAYGSDASATVAGSTSRRHVTKPLLIVLALRKVLDRCSDIRSGRSFYLVHSQLLEAGPCPPRAVAVSASIQGGDVGFPLLSSRRGGLREGFRTPLFF